ncbi:MAG: polymer-forming cytoskeletal protein [Atribacterota bacterium]|nr:polymer-forming cytoskeletal protein [Candidatus Atribacteria bacterium]
MNSIKNEEKTPDIAILGDQSQLTGHFHTPGTVMVQGEYRGSIECQAMIVTRKGMIDAQIDAQSIEIWGVFNGFARSDKVICRSTSKIRGFIMSYGMGIEPGAIFEGGLIFPLLGEENDETKKDRER